MAHDVFISHSSKDKQAADAICHALESNGIKCWIAPRDVKPGAEYAAEIMGGIKNSRIFLLVFSKDSNESKPVSKEIESAFNYEKTVIPFRIEDVEMRDSLRYYLSNLHWLDAFPDDTEFNSLVKVVKNSLGTADFIPIQEFSTAEPLPIQEIVPIRQEIMNIMNCQKCGFQLLDGAEFCNQCGMRQNALQPQPQYTPSQYAPQQQYAPPIQQQANMKFCRECGNQIHSGAVVCVKCGSPTEVFTNQQNVQQQQYAPAPQPTNIVINSSNNNVATAANTNNINMMSGMGIMPSEKSTATAFWLCFFLGYFGVHRFYVGKAGTGILYLFTGGLFGIGLIVDLFMIAFGSFTDSFGRRLPKSTGLQIFVWFCMVFEIVLGILMSIWFMSFFY
ncbi:MAG: TIR domain-containing protein [Oscillospiraceae bacterium]|nr:TIR domain-containing protein [Oscillospiraceae bacterium]